MNLSDALLVSHDKAINMTNIITHIRHNLQFYCSRAQKLHFHFGFMSVRSEIKGCIYRQAT